MDFCINEPYKMGEVVYVENQNGPVADGYYKALSRTIMENGPIVRFTGYLYLCLPVGNAMKISFGHALLPYLAATISAEYEYEETKNKLIFGQNRDAGELLDRCAKE